MKARLFSKTGTLAGSDFHIESEAVIGRDNACDIVLYPHTISSRHARIFRDQKTFFLEDLNSSNGTRLDREKVREPVRLDTLHVITFAKDIDFIFQILPEGFIPKAQHAIPDDKADGLKTEYQQEFEIPDQIPVAPPDDEGMKTTFGQQFDEIPEIPAPDDTLPNQTPLEPLPPPTFILVAQVANQAPQRFPLKKEALIIGRSSACDITLNNDYISGQHAKLQLREGAVYIEDLGSSNGTFVNQEQITQAVQVKPGDTIRLGPATKLAIE